MTKVRLGDWRDRVPIQKLRKQYGRPHDGGLYELLNWPIFHVHTALEDEHIIGFAACVLLDGGLAEDAGTIVDVEHRRKGVASLLRRTQFRDLMVMGYTHYFSESDNDIGSAFNQMHLHPLRTFNYVEGLPTIDYFGGNVAEASESLLERGTPHPHPLSPLHMSRLIKKAEKAHADSIVVQGRMVLQLEKGQARDEYVLGRLNA